MTEDKVCALFRLINFVLFRSVWFGTGVCLCVYLVNVEKANLYLYLRRFIIRCCFLRLFTYLIMLKWVLKNSRYNFGSIWPILYEFWRWQRYCSCANYICFWRNQPKKQKLQTCDCDTKFWIFWITYLGFWSLWTCVGSVVGFLWCCCRHCCCREKKWWQNTRFWKW